MDRSIARVTLVVRDYDEAIQYFTQKLKFSVIEDRHIAEQDKRWVIVAPMGQDGTGLVLGLASNDEQRAAVGNQTGGRVAFFLKTDDFWRDFRDMKAAGVRFIEEPRAESYGTVVVFEDLYGNRWDLLGP